MTIFILKNWSAIKSILTMNTYSINELKRQRDEITNKVLSQLHKDSNLLKVLGDNMAEAATNIQGQGYANFLNARETFLAELTRIQIDYSSFLCPNYETQKEVD